MSPKLEGRQCVLICDGTAHKLVSDDQRTSREILHGLTSTQEETDSRIILYCKYGEQQGYKYIRVKSPDTDVFYILLHYAMQIQEACILFETGRGNKKHLLNITALAEELTQEHCSALLSLHAFTGCDSTSAFKGKGKVKAVKILQQKPKFSQTFAQIGEAWSVTEHQVDELEEFTCLLYHWQRIKKVDELRYVMLKEKCENDTISANVNIDMASLPPCRRSLKQHVLRTNFQVAIWKRAHEPTPEIPDPLSGHRWVKQDEMLVPVWTKEEDELTLP